MEERPRPTDTSDTDERIPDKHESVNEELDAEERPTTDRPR